MKAILPVIISLLLGGVSAMISRSSMKTNLPGFHEEHGASSDVIQTIDKLEIQSESQGYKQVLQEEIITVRAEPDDGILAAAKHAQPQQTGIGQFAIQNNAPMQGQNISDHQHVVQYFGGTHVHFS
jgi:hypothetical protein